MALRTLPPALPMAVTSLLATASLGVLVSPAVAGTDELPVTAESSFAEVEMEFGGGFPMVGDVRDLSGRLSVGSTRTTVDPQGFEHAGETVRTRAGASLVSAAMTGIELPRSLYAVEQTAPGQDRHRIGELKLPVIGTVSGVDGGSEIRGRAGAGGSTAVEARFDGVRLFPPDALGLRSGLLRGALPTVLDNGNLLAVDEGELRHESGTVADESGTERSFVEIEGGFAAIDLFGGAAVGGVTIAPSEPGAVMRSRVETTGLPGEAAADRWLADLDLRSAEGASVVAPGSRTSVEVAPGIAVDIDYAATEHENIQVMEDGSGAGVAGAGLVIRVTIDVAVPIAGDVTVATTEARFLDVTEMTLGSIEDAGDGETTFGWS